MRAPGIALSALQLSSAGKHNGPHITTAADQILCQTVTRFQHRLISCDGPENKLCTRQKGLSSREISRTRCDTDCFMKRRQPYRHMNSIIGENAMMSNISRNSRRGPCPVATLKNIDARSDRFVSENSCQAGCGRVVCTQREQGHVETKTLVTPEFDTIGFDDRMRRPTYRHQAGFL